MTKLFKEQLQNTGVDVRKALDRFMNNESLYHSFLSKFLSDKSYIQLEENYNAGNVREAFMHAHTLKGIAANLEINYLLQILHPLTEKLRADDMEGTGEMMRELKIRHDSLCELIKKNL